MIAKIQEGFVPIALKAAQMGRPPAGIEGQLYRELRRTQAAPQGIGVMNSAGKVLAWTLGFDNEQCVTEFFDQSKVRYEANAKSPVDTLRYRRYPSVEMEAVPDDGSVFALPPAHGEGERCPGNLRRGPGALPGRIVGRAFGDDGLPLSEVRTQDNYVEDVLEISKPMQDELVEASRAATGRFKVPAAIARELVENAYLGMLDVNPLGGDRVRALLLELSIDFWAEQVADGRLKITGKSLAHAKNREDIPSDAGRLWNHRVELDWRGFAELGDGRIDEIILSASGHEKLQWGGPGSHVSPNAADNPVAHLLGGRPLDLSCAVRYGVSAKRSSISP